MESSAPDLDTEKPTTDNFYSPANFAFYEKYPYLPLPSVPYHIRVLNVTRDLENETFHCELTEGIPLREVNGIYTAISYCAGDPKNTRELIVDGVPFNAFANLVQAIEETCNYLLDHETRGDKVSLWVDQICINQSDPQERATQVSFMYEIYKSAFKVAVCLTTNEAAQNLASRESDQAIKCIMQVYNDVPNMDRFLQSVHDCNHKTWENGWGLKEETNCRLNIYLREMANDKDFALGWLDVLRMRRMPWFSRAWVLQEYASHQDVVFLYAWQHIESRKLAAVLMGYLWSGDLPWVERTIAHKYAIDRASIVGEQHRSHDGDINSPGLTLSSYEQKVYNTLRSKFYFSDIRRPLEDLLDHSRMSIASDKRDHVFSCLGLAKRSFGIRPYYEPELSVDDLFVGVMHSLLLNTGSINLIERASTADGDHSETLPSWVPDWSQPIMRADADYYYGRHNDEVHAGGDTETHLEFFENGKILQTKGVLLDVLVEEKKEGAWRGELVDHINTFSSPWNATPSPDAHVSSKPPRKGDEVWILYGSARPFLLRRDNDHYIFLRSVHVYCIGNIEVAAGAFMEYGVDLETETKTLRIR